MGIEQNLMTDVKSYLQNVCGFDVDGSKTNFILNRLEKLAKKHNFEDFTSFENELLSGKQDFSGQVFETVTTKETAFFRDEAPYIMFKHYIMPRLENMYFERVKSALNPLSKQINILSAGCSTGQEAYSIAMTIREYLRNDNESATKLKNYSITGFDISPELIAKAQKGVYTNIEVQRGLNKIHLEAYFKKKARTWAIKDELKKNVNFLQSNMIEDLSHLGKFDIIFCRNVLMFFDLPTKQRILNNFLNILNPGGFLVLGTNENLYEVSNGFTSKMIHGGVVFEKNS